MSTQSFFEGPEKKVELVVAPGSSPLRSLGEDTWHDVVRTAGANVISVIRNEHCDAYLLSESSLFVFDDHCVMITCGLTSLVDAIEQLLETISVDSVAFLVYERKSEHFPERQPTSFLDDVRRLQTLIPGRALRFGDERGHYVQMFHSTRLLAPETNNPTLEVLMHGIDASVAGRFTTAGAAEGRSLAATFGIDEILPGFDTSEHVFDPAGYSLNALQGREYYTLHVTPEEIGSYVSFQTNSALGGNPTALVSPIVELFRPRVFEIVTFLFGEGPRLTVPGYALGDHAVTKLGGYCVTYLQYYTPPSESRTAYELPL